MPNVGLVLELIRKSLESEVNLQRHRASYQGNSVTLYDGTAGGGVKLRLQKRR